MLFYQKTVESVQKEFSVGDDGLTVREAHARLKKYGPNEIKLKGEPLWRILIEPFANVFIGVLLLAVIISLLHGAIIDAVIVIAIIFISAVIYYIQRFSTERILSTLQKHTAQTVDVIRGGETVGIEAAQLVPGDMIYLIEGDKIPADIRLTKASNLRVDESMLTGESEPIGKNSETLKDEKAVYEQSNILFSGSFIVAGQATGIVVLTGNNTEFGRIASLTSSADISSSSPVQQKIDKFITSTVAVVAGMAVFAFFLAISRGIELGEALRFVIALSVSAVPESLPVAISVIMVLGMRRMAAKKALVRSMKAIETIGVITTIATDKTGTLTENKLSVQETWQPKWTKHHLPSAIQRSLNHNDDRRTHDPLDIAMHTYTKAEDVVKLPGKVVAILPFDQSVAMSGNVWNHKGTHELVVKGAPERILDHSKLNDQQREEANETLQSLTSQGYRVIALASTPLKNPVQAFHELASSTAYAFLGFVAVADSLRPAARKAITTAQRAGVTVRMITGDHFETAYSIGLKLGLVESRDQVFDTRTIDTLTDDEFAKKVADIRVFSRVTPENKFRILQVLRLTEVTAMTGDGVNDVPALANAHVGIAMGSGSQIAKDAGSIILLNDNFASIVSAMREGRIIFSNVRRMLLYLLSTNIGEVLVSLVALVIGLPIPLNPVQILWINLVTDTAMVIPLGLEPGEKDVMQRKPIKPNAPIFTRYIISRILIVAIAMAATVLGVYMYFGNLYGYDYGRTLAFSTLVIVQWANAFSARSVYESVFTRIKVMSKPFYVGLFVAIALQYFAFFGPLQPLLHVNPVATSDLVSAGAIGFVIMLAVVELHKLYGRHAQKKRASRPA
ncbi:cation-transporting P-type ATPase [Candidatus Saccharibacteria bacterium]|nr:cation-transporting P-type ATPase [Candidatus Saccharibacteria bacterium]